MTDKEIEKHNNGFFRKSGIAGRARYYQSMLFSAVSNRQIVHFGAWEYFQEINRRR
jgi:hypothetical protein